MPKVPTVEGPSVTPQGIDNAYQTAPRALGAADQVRTQQIGQLGQAAAQYAEMRQKEQNRDDLDAVFRAETALKDDYIKFERDELGKYGADAKGAQERAAKWWADAEKGYGEGLTDRQAFAYRRSATQLRQASAGTLGRHEQTQSNRALQESSQARIGTAVDIAISDPTPERVANSRKEIAEAVNLSSNLAGDPPEVRDRKMGEALTLMHKGVVQHLADTDPDAAKAYYYTHKKEIGGSTQAVIEKTLHTSGLLSEAQKASDGIVAQFGKDSAAALKYIEQNFDGEKEKAVKLEYWDRFTKLKTGEQAMSQSAYETALLATVQGQRVPAAVWSQMDDGHKAAIIEKREAEAKQRQAEAEGRAIKTDYPTWDKINRLVTEDPKAFVQLDVGRFADRLSRADMEEFGKVQRKLRSGDDKALKDAVTLQQQVDQVADGLKLKPNSQEHAALRKSIYDEITVAQDKADKPLDYKQRQEIIDRVTLKAVTSPGMIWDTEKRVYEMTPEERAKAQPSSDDRKALIERFKKRGIDKPSDEQINQAYRVWKGL